MLFRRRARKRAEKYLQMVNSLAENIKTDKRIFPNSNFEEMQKNIYEPIFSLCSLLIASFCADTDAALEMVPTLQLQVLHNTPITKEEYDSMTQRIQDYYLAYRSASIDIQENTNDWLQPSFEKMVEITEDIFQIPHSELSSIALEEYIKDFIFRAKTELGEV